MDDGSKKDPENSSRLSTTASSQPTNIPTAQRPNRNDTAHSPNLGASAMFPSASPPSFVSLEQLLKAAEDVSKSEFSMALAHEISVNRDFKLEKNIPKSSLEERVTEMFHKAFWDALTEQLSSDPPVYEQAIHLLKEIKEILLWLLLPHSTRLKNEINEVLDIALIEQQAKTRTIDVLSYAHFILSTMSRLCAPARDGNIQALREETDTVALYKGIFETLDLMKLDMANFTISSMRPHIQQHSIEYEQKKFKEILNSLEGLTPPVDGLRFTRQWLYDVYDEVMAEDGGNSVLQTDVILRKAYLKVLMWNATETFPETLHLDHERFISLRNHVTRMVLTATVILVTYSNLGPAVQGLADFKNTLKGQVEVLLADVSLSSQADLDSKMESIALQVVKETNECLITHDYPALTEDQEKNLLDLIKGISSEDHNVRQLIRRRILEFLDLAMTSTKDVKVPLGLSTLQNELFSLAGQFLTLIKHNQSVFGEYYNNIIKQRQ